MDLYSRRVLKSTFYLHRAYILKLKKIKCIKRIPGLPEHLSENMIKFIINSNSGNNAVWNQKGCDLKDNNVRIECKSVTSNGPITFGSKQEWDHLYILDARRWLRNHFKLYMTDIGSESEEWKSVRITKQLCIKDTPCGVKIIWDKLKPQVPFKLIFSGTFKDIVKK